MLQKYIKLGGWLRVFILTLALATGLTIVEIWKLFLPETSYVYLALPPWFNLANTVILLITHCLTALISIGMFVFMVKRTRKSPNRIRMLLWVRWIVLFGSSLAEFGVAYAMFHAYPVRWDELISQEIQLLFPQLVLTVCWAAYFKQSTRVSVYFGFIEPDFLEEKN